MRLPGPAATVVSKIAAMEDMNPRLFGAVLVFSALLLITSGLRPPERDRTGIG
jgi:hypothetical protein